MGVSGNLWSFLKEGKPLLVYDVERRMAIEPKQEKGFNLELIWGTLSYFAS